MNKIRVKITLLEHCVLSYIIEHVQNLEMVTRKTMFSEKTLQHAITNENNKINSVKISCHDITASLYP